MPGSVISVFSEAEDFGAALREEGCLGLLVTERGEFRARLTQVALHRLRLGAAEERLPRIAFVAVPAEMILVSLPSGSGPAPIWGGLRMRTGEIMTLGAGQRLHARTDGPCRWGSIWSRPEPCEHAARNSSAWVPPSTFASAGCTWCTARCATETPMQQAYRRSRGATGFAALGVLPPIIAPSSASCHPRPTFGRNEEQTSTPLDSRLGPGWVRNAITARPPQPAMWEIRGRLSKNRCIHRRCRSIRVSFAVKCPRSVTVSSYVPCRIAAP
jgi:hypothetical protein